MSILLDDKERKACYAEWEIERAELKDLDYLLLKAQLKKVADAIESMTADGWFLEDIVKALLKEIE